MNIARFFSILFSLLFFLSLGIAFMGSALDHKGDGYQVRQTLTASVLGYTRSARCDGGWIVSGRYHCPFWTDRLHEGLYFGTPYGRERVEASGDLALIAMHFGVLLELIVFGSLAFLSLTLLERKSQKRRAYGDSEEEIRGDPDAWYNQI